MSPRREKPMPLRPAKSRNSTCSVRRLESKQTDCWAGLERRGSSSVGTHFAPVSFSTPNNRGAFSTVFEAREKETGEKFAIKCINKKYIKKKLLEREIEIMTNIRHENILFCKAVFENETYIYLVLEL